jgi:hypothetical protein
MAWGERPLHYRFADSFTGTGTTQWHQRESVVAVYNWTAVQDSLLS